MHTIEAKAAELRQSVESSTEGFGFDISVWITLITAVMQMLADCKKKPADLPKLAKNPGVRGRLRLRQIVRNTARVAVPDEPLAVVVAEVLRLGKETTAAEAKKLFAEAAKA